MAINAAITFSAILGAKVIPICPEPEYESSDESEYYEDEDEEMNSLQGHETQRNQDIERVLDLFAFTTGTICYLRCEYTS